MKEVWINLDNNVYTINFVYQDNGIEIYPDMVKVRISYNGYVLEGFSTQKYIEISGIKHIDVGDKFNVTVDTNDTGVLFKCNDTSVAEIDSRTGKITAKKAGMVLITVTSDSGLEDSCLIEIDE